MNTMIIQVEKATLENFEKYLEGCPHSINSTEAFVNEYPFKVMYVFNASKIGTYVLHAIPCNEVTCLVALDMLCVPEPWFGLGFGND